jgi:lysophosphatidylcholine acyltransferase/lyso-PAF acetyltransferase
MDIFLVMAIADGIPGFVAKRETMQIPYIGFKSQVWQGLYVDNRISANANSVATQVSERAKRDDMPPITIFPEGTTTNGKALSTYLSIFSTRCTGALS